MTHDIHPLKYFLTEMSMIHLDKYRSIKEKERKANK